MSVCFRIRSYIQHWQRNKIYGNNGLRKVLFFFFQTQKIHWSSYHSKCNFYYYEGENLDLIMKYAYIAFWSYIGAWFSFIHYSSSSYNKFKIPQKYFWFCIFFDLWCYIKLQLLWNWYIKSVFSSHHWDDSQIFSKANFTMCIPYSNTYLLICCL